MSLLHAIIVLAVVGFLVWLITTYIPMPEVWKRAIIVLAIVCVCIWVLSITGLIGHAEDIKVPQVK